MLIGMILASSAIGIEPAVPSNSPGSWITPDDYPRTSLAKNESGYTTWSILIDPSGRPRQCEVTASSGYPELDARSCALLMQRARFRPAINQAGKKTFAVYGSVNSWLAGDNMAAINAFQQSHPVPSTALDMTGHGAGTVRARSITVEVGILFSAGGAPGGCGGAKGQESKLTVRACEAAMKTVLEHVYTDPSGAPVEVVRNMKVRLDP